MAYRIKIISCCFLVCFHLSIFAQEINVTPNVWMLRARALTDEIVKDASLLNKLDRALMYARLAEAWWKNDQERARAWMRKSIVEVEAAPEQEEAVEHSRRLSTARAIFSIIASRDEKLSKLLLAVFNSDNGKSVQRDDRKKNADVLVEVALANLDNSAQRAAELGLASLQAGVSYRLGPLILRMHKIDRKLAESLFNEGLNLARAKRDEALLDVLAGAAFPHKFYFPPPDAPILSEKIRIAVLNLYAELMLSAPTSVEAASANCKFSPAAAKLLDQYTALLPQYAGALRQAVVKCQTNLNPTTQQYQNDEMRERPLKTADDYLQAAKDTSNLQMRGLYLARAAYTSFSAEGKPDRAIEIIEGMNEEERDLVSRDVWNNWRWWFASSAALKHHQNGDQYMMQKVIDAVPPGLRGFALVDLIDGLAGKNESSIARQLLEDARGYLAKADLASPEREHFYLSLTRLYALLLPADGPTVLGEAIKAMNQAEQQRSNDKSGAEAAF
ncbi:MAG TPA: hypothetical protein VF766_04570, partial [Pyrinomonadaceae bacterium]